MADGELVGRPDQGDAARVDSSADAEQLGGVDIVAEVRAQREAVYPAVVVTGGVDGVVRFIEGQRLHLAGALGGDRVHFLGRDLIRKRVCGRRCAARRRRR